MKAKLIVLSMLFCAGITNQVRSQCSVNINTPVSTLICAGDSIQLTALGSGGGSAQVLDQSQLVYNGGTSARTLAGYSEWQSFTAGITGTMIRLDIGFFTLINGVGQLKIFSGSGTAGTLLWGQTVNVVCGGGNCTLPFNVSLPVIAGQVYTFQFIPGAGMPDPYGIQISSPGPYAGGVMAIVDPSGTYPTGFDMVFKTYVGGSGHLYYHWSTGSNDSVTVVNTGGEYYVAVTDSAGCTAVDSIHIADDFISLSTTAIPTTCGNNNGSAALNITGGNLPFTLNWSNGEHTDSITDLSSGTYSVTVSDSVGCSVTGSAVVNSSNAISVNITEDKAVICAGDTVHICATAGFNSYTWNIGNTDSCIMVNDAGNYYVTVTGANGCSAESNHLAVDVFPLPSVSVSVNGDTLSAYNAVTYQWYLNGNQINGATHNMHIASQPGNYTVAVTDTNGCSATSNAIVITGVEDLPSNRAQISPNPFTDEINIRSNITGGNIIFTDVTGRKIAEQKQETTNHKLQTAALSRGVYFLQIIIDGEKIVKQMVKQ